MKKFLLGMAVCLGVSAAMADVTYPPRYFESDFVQQDAQGYESPQGYVTYGVAGTVESTWAQFFPNYSSTEAFWFIGLTSGEVIAFTPNGLTNSGTNANSDQWLITPEFNIDNDVALLNFTVYQSGSSSTQHVSLYISEGGTEKSDFTKVKDIDFAGTGSANSVSAHEYSAVLNGYKDKNVRMAFVSRNNTAGIIGFSDIVISEYYANISNAQELSSILIDPEATTAEITVNFFISTPVSMKGFTGVLRTETGQEITVKNTRIIGNSKIHNYPLRFKEAIDMDGRDELGYTITITPTNESLTPVVLTGSFIKVYGQPYQANALVEEITGSWCGWCPRGMVFMNYYKDKYNSLGKGKVIPLMLHGDDMMAQIPSYLNLVTAKMGSVVGANNVGYPMAMVNRSLVGDPGTVEIPSVVENGTSLAQTTILEAGPDAEDSSKIRVRASSKAAINCEGAPISMAVVLMEDKVHGNTRDWQQMDYYPSSYTAAQIKNAYGEEMWPYWAPFYDDAVRYGNYHVIPYTKMYYPDVAWGIAPSYYGEPLYGWTNEEARVDDITIEIPSMVQNIDNCSVVVMLIASDGSIVGSDIMAHEDWSQSVQPGTGVGAVRNGSLKLTAIPVADGLGIRIGEQSNIAVYSIDGRVLFNGVLTPGEHILPVAKSQTVIVRAESAGSVATSKVIL